MQRLTYLTMGALLLTGSAFAQVADDIDPVKVTLDSGVLVGQMENNVQVFRGVPYAKPPVGDMRWRAAVAPEPWPGERLALTHEPPCTQPVTLDGRPNGGGVAGMQAEDCLYLTAFVPPEAEDAPIVVWMHGGASFLGAGHLGSYDGTSNAQNGVITVSINYRLGPMANLNHPALSQAADSDEALGNFALTDAVAALEWVQRNAEALGGDPDNVTIAGQSAGGAMVMDLLSIPSAEGLFHKAVVQSGALLRAGQSLADAEQRGVQAMSALSLSEDITADQLRSISAQTFSYNQATRAGLGTVIDGRFRPVSTLEAMQAGDEIDVPVLVGSNTGERGFDSARRVANLAGDTGAGAWLYSFDYVPGFRSEWTNGPIHSAELMFTFDSIDSSGWSVGPNGRAGGEDREVAAMVQSCWLAFYKMDPAAKSINCAGGTEWPVYTEASDAAMQFSDTARVVNSQEIPDGP
ncbi:MAG TPA: carboxylesterase/lipase family protein [Pseudohongiella sp.]|nr:carboxylesterase [Gammaproteobacteria bacterium]HBN14656.1 carboxylesterase/lipase family protein [Pseudohongiella sp.]